MIGIAISFLLIILFLLILPLLFGTSVIGIMRLEDSVFNCYIVGFLSLMAICELLAVPFVFFKLNFSVTLVVFLIIVTAILLTSIVRTGISYSHYVVEIKSKTKSYSVIEYLSLFAMLISLTVIIVNSVRLHVIDQDDSRFVVTAADMLRTNTLFLADPNTGIIYDNWSYGEDVAKDIVAPHAVFCAILSKLTSTSVTLFMHNIYPIFLYILAVFIYYNLISELIEDIETIRDSKHKEAYKFLFITIVLLFAIFQFSTKSTRETMFLIRLWQGKAIFAGIIIPALFWILYRIYRKPDKSSYGLLFITSIAGCLTTSMATLILPLMLGVYGIVYGIARRSIKISLFIWSNAIIPVLLALLSLYIRNEMIVC